MRTDRYLYVEYIDGEREFYELRTDPYELRNLAPRLAPHRLEQLHDDLARLEGCHTADSCWAAAHVAPLPAARRCSPAVRRPGRLALSRTRIRRSHRPACGIRAAAESRLLASCPSAGGEAAAQRQRPLPALGVQVGSAQRAAGRVRGDPLSALWAVAGVHAIRMAPALSGG